MKQHPTMKYWMALVIFALILAGCQSPDAGYDSPVAPIEETQFIDSPPLNWSISRLDSPAFFRQLGRGYLRLRAPGAPCTAYGDDHLYYSCFDGENWSFETVDGDFGVGVFASLAIDADGWAHIAYYDQVNGRLKYARQGADGWTLQVVAEADADTDRTLPFFGNGGAPFIALDADQAPHISFYDYDQRMLEFASLHGEEWVFEVIDSTPGAGVNSSLAFDSAGGAHVAYFEAESEVLKYAWQDEDGWQTAIVDDDGQVGKFASIAVDSKNYAHIAYYDIGKTRLKYAAAPAKQKIFTIRTLTDLDNTGEFASLALDSRDQPHIAYYRDVEGSHVYYIRKEKGKWIDEKVSTGERDLVGLGTTIALDSNDRPYFAYRHSSENQLRVKLRSAEGEYETQVVFQSTRVGEMTSLAVDSQDRVHLIYENDSQDELRYALKEDGQWQFSLVEQSIDTGVHPSLKLTDSDLPHATFWGLPSIKYARQTAEGDWLVDWVEVHDNGDWTGWYTSLALGEDDIPHVSYYDWLQYDLKYATIKNNRWETKVVDRLGDVGGYTSIVLDDSDQPLIAYYDFTDLDLKLAWQIGKRWHTRTLDDVGVVELYPSLARTADGQIYLSYISDNGNSLRVAHLDGQQWTIETIDRGGYYFKATSLALDSKGRPHVVYYDGKHKVLRYAYQTGAGWAVSSVNAEGNYGMGASLGLDSEDRPHISFQDVIDQDLMYATTAE
ncbi:MAG: hypothetical protein RBT34_00125 [Anaerolineaceae bacterium]|jgi:hypothetical protein|nr:hypothetical protein [Anaerolineaceae bacterium]